VKNSPEIITTKLKKNFFMFYDLIKF